MIHLIQLFNMIDDKKLFIGLFSYFKDEAQEMGYSGFEGELFNEMLDNHFGIEILDDKQLERITASLLKRDDLSFLNNLGIYPN